MGYIQETWQDIWIDTKDGQTTFYHPTHPAIMSSRDMKASENFPPMEGYLPNHFIWLPCWWPELPAGYSCIFTHPFNHDELPFHTFTAVVDCDSFKMCYHGSAMPFVLKENFSGMIKKGTPMYQMIPFKRESWESEINPYDGDKLITLVNKVKQHFWDGYKKLHWTKKDFK
jgi:hypothetical protein